MVKTIFAGKDREQAHARWREVAGKLHDRFRDVAGLMDETVHDGLARMTFAKSLHSKTQGDTRSCTTSRRTLRQDANKCLFPVWTGKRLKRIGKMTGVTESRMKGYSI